MRQNAMFTKIVCGITAYAFMLAVLPRPVRAAGLAPESFDQMYSLAQQGNVEALRASVYRGLNIDSLNRDGNTGLCVAAMRGDAYTYNAFRAAGANPHHPCVQRVSNYEGFVNNSRAVPVDATSRDAYGALGKEEYKVSSRVWWGLGGLLLIGGAIALIAGHHGGGKGGDSSSPSGEPYNSLGTHSATSGNIIEQTSGVATNSQNRTRTAQNLDKIVDVNLLSNVLSGTEYMDVVLKSVNGGSFTNKINTVLQLGAGTIGMDAAKSSSAINEGYINVNAFNSAVGMVGSESSSVTNQGSGIIDGSSTNGIDLNFTGYKTTNSIVGMYADTNSSILNLGDIKGSAVQAISTATVSTAQSESGISKLASDTFNFGDSSSDPVPASGTMVGMEAMILNVGPNLSSNTVKVKNDYSGKIYLSANSLGTTNDSVLVSLVGMGSWLDDAFVNGSQNINRTENASLINNGAIDLKYSGVYTPSDSTALKSGLGGIIGMRADANTKATNVGTIKISLDDAGTAANVSAAAGMQSVHGGNLTNGGDITIAATAGNNRINYGMLAVKGAGKLADTLSATQQIINSANINLQASNSYGMASFNGGTLKNTGTITLGKPVSESQTNAYKNNIALYGYGSSKQPDLQNTGNINIYSYESMAMQNDFAGATKLENKGNINVYASARDTHVFGGAYGELHNAGEINYMATPTNAVTTPFATGIDVFKDYTPENIIAVMNTKAQTLTSDSSSGSSGTTAAPTTSNTEQIFNDVLGTINIKEASNVTAMAVETQEGKAFNRGTINITTSETENSTGTIGMFLAADTDSNAQLVNEALILTNSLGSVAMVSNSTQNAAMKNAAGALIQTDFKNSIGMFALNKSTVQNAGTIKINNMNSMGIYARGASIIQNAGGGVINIGADGKNVANSYGIFTTDAASAAQIDNNGQINVWTTTSGAGIYAQGADSVINNNSDINVYSNNAYGIFASQPMNIYNNAGGHITVGQDGAPVRSSYAIYAVQSGSASGSSEEPMIIKNSGVIDFYNNPAQVGYAIYSTIAGEITNSGTINLKNPYSNGIYAENSTVTNKSAFNIDKDYSAAMIAAGSTNIINDTTGVIQVGTQTQGVRESYGISSTDTATGKVTNDGEIHLYNTADSYAVLAKNQLAVENNNLIKSYNDNSSAIYTLGTNNVVNNKNISVLGNNVYAIRGFGSDSTLSVTNAKNAEITVGEDSTQSGGYAVGGDKIGTVTNNGKVTVNSYGSYGIFANSGTEILNGKDDGQISMTGANSVGIRSGETDTVTNAGKINLTGNYSTGIATTSVKTLTNSGSISANGLASTGINISGGSNSAKVSNSGLIEMTNSSGIGILADNGAEITNTTTGLILMDGINSTAISSGKTATVTNDGEILLTKSGANGIYALSTGSVNITNNKSISLSDGQNANGIWAQSSSATITNEKDATITVGASGETGGYAIRLNSGSVNNYGTVTLNSQGTAIFGSTGVTLQNGQAGTEQQQGKIETFAANSYAVDLTDSSVVNYGQIITNGNGSRAINLKGSGTNKVENKSASSILVRGSTADTARSYAIYGESAIDVTNDGTIAAEEGSAAYSNGAKLIYAAQGSKITNNYIMKAGDNSVAIETGFDSEISTGGSSEISVGNNSSAIIAGASADINTAGKISVGSGSETGTYVYAIKAGSASTVTNFATITVGNFGAGIWVDEHSSVTSKGPKISVGNGAEGRYVYGIYAGNGSDVTNSADITVGDYGQGIFVNNGNVTNSGKIYVTGAHSLGMNVYIPSDESNITISNTGTITVNDPTTSKAIYVSKDYTLKEKPNTDPVEYEADKMKYNEGINWNYVTVNCVNGGVCILPDSNEDKNATKVEGQPTYVYGEPTSSNGPTSLLGFGGGRRALMSAVRLVNTGSIVTPTQDVDFGTGTENSETNAVGQGGSYTANSFTGTIYAAPSIVQDGFETSYTNADTLIGADNGVNVVSESYLFDATKRLNSSGNTDIVMTMKPFAQTTQFNPNLANYFEQNYNTGKGEGVFNLLKLAGNAAQYQNVIDKEFGFAMVPNLAKQSFDAEKTVGREINNDLLEPTNEDSRAKFGAVGYVYDVDGKQQVSGYKDKVAAVYGYYDAVVNAQTRAGLGASVIRTDGDYDSDGSRYNNIFEVYAPVIFETDYLRAMIKPKAGLAFGHYRRTGALNTYKASTKEYFYGFDSEARQSYDLGGIVALEPNIGFNLTGLYMDNIKEKDGGLKIKDENVISAQAFVGADVKKKFEIDTHQAVAAIVGAKYYHEFGQKYRAKATMADMDGNYEIVSNRLKRNFGLMNAKAQYNYDKWTLGATVGAPISQDDNVYYLLNMGYQF